MRIFILSAIIAASLCMCVSAFATTYAHITATGEVVDPQPDASASIYLKRYNSNVTKNWQVERVPDGARHNATYSGSLTPGSPQFMDTSKYVNRDWTDAAGNPVPHDP